jgi:hypothetical protein
MPAAVRHGRDHGYVMPLADKIERAPEVLEGGLKLE